MTFEMLKEKALSLPLAPGVYIMRDNENRVIYVGKAKKLKNRVSQYFQDTASHSPKTRMMVSKIFQFEVIVSESEFEALVLECSLIKRYQPKYNILLKDDKGYPYVRLSSNELYPRLSVSGKIQEDGAEYFGPFGSRGTTNALIDTLQSLMKLPTCSKLFPRDVGRTRPCLNYHMKTCAGWCTSERTVTEYAQVIRQVRQLLTGNYRAVSAELRKKMLAAAESLAFETAAAYKQSMEAIESLGKKQLVTAATLVDTDVVGYYQNEVKACFTVLHFSDGNLLDKDYEIVSASDEWTHSLSSLIKQYYFGRTFAPKMILLPTPMEDSDLFSQLLLQKYNRKTNIRVPKRGDALRLLSLAEKNAQEEVQRVTHKEEHLTGVLALLGKMLQIKTPIRIEAYDISNISGTDIVGGMIVFENGKPKKGEYRRFKLEELSNQDDYASMRQVILRRMEHLKNQDTGFSSCPDLILVDGGREHAVIAKSVLQEISMDSIAVFGMVKDSKHRTRALVTAENMEIAIDTQPAVFSLIGCIQEEVHRYAISYHRFLRSKRLKYSKLDAIPGIGEVRKYALLRKFHSIRAIEQATQAELETVLPKPVAKSVYLFFHKQEE